MLKILFLIGLFALTLAFPGRLNTNNETEICSQCESVIDNFIESRKSGADRETARKIAATLCEYFFGWGPAPCEKYSEFAIDVELYLVDNRDIKPEEICGIYLQNKGCVNRYAKKWQIDIPTNENSVKFMEVKSGGKPLKIVQITDVHYDPLYKAGTNAKCDLPLCCEERNGVPSDPRDAAGSFADYRFCDMSTNSIVNLLQQIRETHKEIDLIYFTGDVIAHKAWETSKQSNLDTLDEFFGLIDRYFPNITVYSILGNHDAHPADMYAPLDLKPSGENVSTQWLFDGIAKTWTKWLPSSALDTIKLGGFYTVLVKPRFRIIALNSNVCNTENFWLFYDDEDPYGQLKWLVQVLLEAEKNNEKVHILSHVPAGEAKCHRQWQYNYNRIVKRFSRIISAQFNGHTHVDEFKIFKNENNEVINVAFNGGSFATLLGLNPDYRIYDVDSRNLMVLDYNQYTFDLSLANAFGGPDWYKLYSFKAAYGLKSMDYASLNSFHERLQSDSRLAQQYVNYHVRGSEFAFEDGCDDACIQNIICRISAVDADEGIKCM